MNNEVGFVRLIVLPLSIMFYLVGCVGGDTHENTMEMCMDKITALSERAAQCEAKGK